MKRPSDKQQPLSTERHLVYNIFFIDIAKTILQKKNVSIKQTAGDNKQSTKCVRLFNKQCWVDFSAAGSWFTTDLVSRKFCFMCFIHLIFVGVSGKSSPTIWKPGLLTGFRLKPAVPVPVGDEPGYWRVDRLRLLLEWTSKVAGYEAQSLGGRALTPSDGEVLLNDEELDFSSPAPEGRRRSERRLRCNTSLRGMWTSTHNSHS